MTREPRESAAEPIYRFGRFELDPVEGRLTRDGIPRHIQEKALLLLRILLDRPGEVVTRTELIRCLWPDTVVEFDRGLNTAVRKVRAALGESAEDSALLVTVPRRGYKFMGEVERASRVESVAMESVPAPASSVPAPPSPTLAPRGLPVRVWGPVLAMAILALGLLGPSRGTVPGSGLGDMQAGAVDDRPDLHHQLSALLEHVQPCPYCAAHFRETGRLYDCEWCRNQLGASRAREGAAGDHHPG